MIIQRGTNRQPRLATGWLLCACLLGFVLLGLLCFNVAPAAAQQPAILTGTVLDPDGRAVPGADIRLLGANRIVLARTQTGGYGTFSISIEAIPAGDYELVTEASGFARARRVITVPLPAGESLDIHLSLVTIETRVTVTARHGAPEETLHEPATLSVRTNDELRSHDAGHLPRQLAAQPGVLTQETTPGQGSPVLRGQGAQTVLYLLDGVRYNNSTYRSGNTQYLGWIPAASTEAVEIFLGPAGTQYGSDALGGAVNILSTGLPPWQTEEEKNAVRWRGASQTFFRTADLAAGQSFATSIAGQRAAFSLGGSFTRSQDVRTGGARDSHSALTRFFGFDAAEVRGIIGSRLPGTAYTQASIHSKFGYRFDDNRFLTLSWLQSEQWGVRRYDRLAGGEGRLRSDFAPQRLRFAYARYQRIGTGRWQNLTATFSLNQQTDGQARQTRETSPLEIENNRVTALGATVASSWRVNSKHSLDGGVEFFDEFVRARKTETDPFSVTDSVRPRFPNGTRYASLGLYLSDDWRPAERLVVEGGLRFSHFRFRTKSAKNIFNGVPAVPDDTQTFSDVTFHSGLTYSVTESFVLAGRIARGFRAPSVFDLGQLGVTGGGFEVSPGAAVAIAADIGDSAGSAALSTGQAWTGLDPEVLWSFEGGLRWQTERISGGVTLFDSEFFDSIQRRALIVSAPVVGQTIGGETITAQDLAGRIFVALDPRPVVSRANAGRVRIKGLEASSRFRWNDQWSSALGFSLQRGRELDTGNFARRIAPPMFNGSARWSARAGKFWLELFGELSGAQTRLNPAELDDPRIGAFRTPATIAEFFNFGATRLGLVSGGILNPTGETLLEVTDRVLGPGSTGAALFTRTGGFGTLGLRGNYRLGKRGDLLFSVTNLTDGNYRRHGSGFDAPGLGLSLTYRLRFE